MSEEQSIDDIREKKMEQMKSDTDDGAAAEAPSEPFHVSSRSDLQEAAEDYGVVLVDFYADWCGPCKMIEPVVEKIAAETGAAVAKVDVDTNQQLAAQYSVQGVPTLYLFADGEPAERVVGMQSEDQLFDLVEQYS